MALFMTLMLVVSDIFLSVSMVQRKTLAVEQGAKEMQFVMEQIAQAVRLNKINYSYYNLPLTGKIGELALIDRDQKETIFSLTSTNCAVGVTKCVKRSAAGVETILSPNNLEMEKFDFAGHRFGNQAFGGGDTVDAEFIAGSFKSGLYKNRTGKRTFNL